MKTPDVSKTDASEALSGQLEQIIAMTVAKDGTTSTMGSRNHLSNTLPNIVTMLVRVSAFVI